MLLYDILLTDNERCICEIKSLIVIAKAKFNKKKKLFTGKLNLNLRKTSKILHLERGFVWF